MARRTILRRLLAIEMLAIAALAALDFDAEIYGRPIAVFLGVPLLWPAFRLFSDRRSDLTPIGVALGGSLVWVTTGPKLYPPGGHDVAVHAGLIWATARLVPMFNTAILIFVAVFAFREHRLGKRQLVDGA